MNFPHRAIAPHRRGACPALTAPMRTGDGLLVRLNTVAGGFSPNQLIGLCESALRHGNGGVEVTARGSFQIRGLSEASAPMLAAEVDARGIAVRTGVPVETGPLAGLDPDEIADPQPLAARLREGIAEARVHARLGPKVSVVVDGGGSFGMEGVVADVRLTAERAGDGRSAPRVWRLAIAGDAATAKTVACLDEERACAAVLALLHWIAELGIKARARDLLPPMISEALCHDSNLRSIRPPSVLPDISPSRGEISRPLASRSCCDAAAEHGNAVDYSFDAADRSGAATQLISPREGEMSGRTEGGPFDRSTYWTRVTNEPETSADIDPFRSMHHLFTPIPLADSRHALPIALPYGSSDAALLIQLVRAAETLGITEIRLASRRRLIFIGPTETTCLSLRQQAAALGFITEPRDPRLAISACPGTPACASGHLAARDIAHAVAAGAGDALDGSLSIHISGCAKGCAHPGKAELTLVGGENGAGLVVGGTAASRPLAYAVPQEAARRIGAALALVSASRHSGESSAACAARLGADRLAAAFQQG